MAEHVLHGAQVARVAVGQRGAGVAQRMVRHPGSLDLGSAQVAVDDVAHAAAAQAVPAREVAVGDDQRLAELVGRDGSRAAR